MSTTTQTYTAYQLTDFSLSAIKQTVAECKKPAACEVLVKMRAVSLNYRDIMVATGIYSRNLKLPLVPLSDGAGEVVEVGELVTRFKKGDRVSPNFMTGWTAGPLDQRGARTALGGAIDGVLREYALFNEESLVAIPEHLSFEEAATLPCAALTAWHGLIASGNVKAGETVLVMGSGGVSVFALQFAVVSGARVIATSSNEEKLKRLLRLGASDGINYQTTPDWDKSVLAMTGGVGVDHVVEVGGSGTLERSLNACKIGGQISLIGVLAGVGQMNPISVLMKNIRLQGIFVGSRLMFEEMNRAVVLHQIRPVIDKVFPASEIVEALNYMKSGSHFGKVVLKL